MPTPFRTATVLASLLILPVTYGTTAPTPATGSAESKSTIASVPAGNGEGTDSANPRMPDPAEGKFWKALTLLKSNQPADLAAGRAVLQAAADLEFTHAQVLLGNCLVAGSYGFAKDVRKGVGLFRLAAERGNAFAKVSYGQCLVTGTGVSKDVPKAAEWLAAALAPDADFSRPTPPPDFLAKAAEANEAGKDGMIAGELERDPVGEAQATAHFLLGQICDRQKKTAEAQAHYAAAASAGPNGRDGIYLAALQAAINYAFGNGIPRDLTKANEMLAQSRKLAGRMGVSLIHNYVSLKIVDEFATADLEESVVKAGEAYESELQLKIAATFADKKSKNYNIPEAVKWYELAAESDKTWAMLELAFIYVDGSLGAPDPARAFSWFERAGGGDRPKHLQGAANLAICYQNGFGTPRDPAKAAAIFEKFRDQHFLCYLGSIGQSPAAPLTYEKSMNLLKASAKTDAHAQYFMGLRYLGGWDVDRDLPTAVAWFREAAKAKIGAADTELGLLSEYSRFSLKLQGVTLDDPVEYYRRGSELDDPDAIANYASLLDAGNGVTRDLARAEALDLRCLQLAPENGRAHNNLAVIYEGHLQTALAGGDNAAAEKFRRKMLDHFEAACQLKLAYAARNLGFLYYKGELVPLDYKRAYGYFEKTSEWGLTGVHYTLGKMHELGQGMPITLTEAAYHYRLAALEKNEDALRRLVDFYVEGKGVSQDYDRALYWISIMSRVVGLQAVTDLGDRYLKEKKYEVAKRLFEILATSTSQDLRGFALQRLSLFYQHGLGVPKNSELAWSFQKRAVDDGNLSALYEYGLRLFMDGKKSEAAEAWGKSAKRGHANSEYKLGLQYRNGDGVPRDLKRAMKLWRDAAGHGAVEAKVSLATLTLDNIPNAPDLETAIKLATEAAANGRPEAQALRDKLLLRRKM